jgi:hypothetical protein
MGEDIQIKDIKLLIFIEDNGTIKDKTVIIIEKDSIGVKVQLWDEKNKKEVGVPFFLPWHRVSKIKDIVEKEEKDGN